MYLEKLEIQGFKSFAKKNVLKFGASEKSSKHGITVIVGPNGAGKSNIADAVRWVLGEQSVKLLRGKKSEDVIFSGSNKKASLSLSEVSLYLNNSDGRASASAKATADKAVDYREVVVTRRLYRDGESEYLLNGSKVRLLDISLLLAKAKFGQRAYSVIGQGMVENFLNTSMAERKEFFDEATGVKMYQIKRDDSMNKLRNVRDNLTQAESLLNEIEPRMRSLTRQMKRLEKREEVIKELAELQQQYYASGWHKLNKELKQINKRLLASEEKQQEREKELAKVNGKLNQYQFGQYNNPEQGELVRKKKKLEGEKNELSQKLAEAKAKIGISLEVSGSTDLSWLVKREGMLQEEIVQIKENRKEWATLLEDDKKQAAIVKKKQAELDKRLSELRSRLGQSRPEDESQAGLMARVKLRINELLKINKEVFLYLEKENIKEVKKHFAKLQGKLQKIKNELGEEKGAEKDEAAFSKINKEISALEEEREKIMEQYISLQGEIAAGENKIEYEEKTLGEKLTEIEEIKKKLSQNKGGGKDEIKELEKDAERFAKEIKEINKKLEEVEIGINKINEEGQKKRQEMVNLQKRSYELQSEHNQNINAFNEIKVDKARVETKLEDLENEIRNETNNLRMIIDTKDEYQNIDKPVAQERIQKLKRQLELIGGIDPEIKKEYEETNVRYEFLSSQSSDLQSGIRSLEKIINELDKTITEKFDSAFKDIAKQFERYFKVLFNGGSAKISKMMSPISVAEDDNEDEGDESTKSEVRSLKYEDEKKNVGTQFVAFQKKKNIVLRKQKEILAGIEIQATPPGKKIKSIAMLSGGERAMTAIALICAIISVNPSPFVVLDEVDAALDEANSGRFGKILEELSHKTQFIIITHNRSIMYKADIIYGVTMSDDGVSKLLSIKIDEVKKVD